MSERTEDADFLLLCRGFVALVLIVVLGVVAAESQLDRLTGRQDFGELLNVRREAIAGVYSLYLLGTGYQLKSLYSVAEVSNTDHSLSVKVAGSNFTVPTVFYVDLDGFFAEGWKDKLVVRVLSSRQVLGEYLAPYSTKLRNFVNSIGP